MKKTRFLVLSAAALLTACTGGTVTGPDETGPTFGVSTMGSGGFTEPEEGATVQSEGSSMEPGAYNGEPSPGGGTDLTSTREGSGTSMMGSGA